MQTKAPLVWAVFWFCDFARGAYNQVIMSELWTPRPYETQNVTNIFDMMMLYQEQLDSADTLATRQMYAQFAHTALKRMLRRMPDADRNLMVVTDLTVIEEFDDQQQTAVIEQGVGLHGELLDVNCIQMPETEVPIALSLSMDVTSLFPVDDPDNLVALMNNAKAPISNVRYIETLAS